jgi:RNA recognition motif-containing protein
VYVNNLPPHPPVSAPDLEDLCRPHGPIPGIWIAINPAGFAFLTYPDSETAQIACQALNGHVFQGEALKFEVAE